MIQPFASDHEYHYKQSHYNYLSRYFYQQYLAMLTDHTPFQQATPTVPPSPKPPRPKAARHRSLRITKSLDGHTPQPVTTATTRPPRPRHGEHKWMRQLGTLENPDRLLEDLLTPTPHHKPPTPFPFLPVPQTDWPRPPSQYNRECDRGHYEASPTPPSPVLSQESYFTSFTPSTHGKSQSLPKLLLETEKSLPRLTTPTKLATPSNLLIDQRSSSSIPKLPRITNTCLTGYQRAEVAVTHKRSRSYSDPTIHPLGSR